MKKTFLLLPFLLTGCFDYSDGDKAGIVTKLSNKGLFCKTWEGEINQGGMRKETVMSSDGKSSSVQTVPNTFSFTVEDVSLVPKIQAALDSGDRITIHYQQELLVWPCRGSTSYFVKSVK